MIARPRTSLARSLLAAQLLWANAAVAVGGTHMVDDSGSLPYDAPLKLTWRSPAPRHGVPDNSLIGSTLLRVRLNGPHAHSTKKRNKLPPRHSTPRCC